MHARCSWTLADQLACTHTLLYTCTLTYLVLSLDRKGPVQMLRVTHNHDIWGLWLRTMVLFKRREEEEKKGRRKGEHLERLFWVVVCYVLSVISGLYNAVCTTLCCKCYRTEQWHTLNNTRTAYSFHLALCISDTVMQRMQSSCGWCGLYCALRVYWNTTQHNTHPKCTVQTTPVVTTNDWWSCLWC